MQTRYALFGLCFILLGSVLGSACAAGGNVPRTHVTKSEPAGTTSSSAVPIEPIAALNARAKAVGVTETLHGTSVADPYRSLEQHSELTDAWIEAQTARTSRAIDALQSPQRDARLLQLLSIGSIGEVGLGGTKIFVTVREGDREQPALYALDHDSPAQAAVRTTTLAQIKPLLDPLSYGERASIDYFYPSPSGKHVAVGISHNGDERSVLQVINVASGAALSEKIEHAKWSSVAWLNDETGFYYTRYPAEGEPEYNVAEPDTYFPSVLFHRLGSPLPSDVRVWTSKVATDFPFLSVSDDDRYVVLHNQRSWTATDVQLLDRGPKPRSRVFAPDASHPLVPIVVGIDRESVGAVHRDQLFLLTNIGADRKRIISAPIARAGEQAAWRDIVPEGAGTIEAWTIAKDELAVHTVEDVRSKLTLVDLAGKAVREVALPTSGSIESLTSDPATGALAYTFSSFFYPPTLFARAPVTKKAVNTSSSTSELAIRYQVTHDLDLSAYEVTEVKVPSADGTKVPLHAVHKKGIARDGQNPVLLTAYGGFNVSLLPDFTRNAIYWLERGGVYVVANLRGGGEYGESWHRSGMLENKPHVFEDFEAVLRWLTQSGISNPERIAIIGGSNGGLLMGAAITRAPSLFAAAIAQVGLYDMLRYHLFPPAALWITEYGDPRIAKDAQWLAGYSPYHHVVDGTRYPAVLVETADHDTRVHWAHSTKLTARLQEAQGGPRPIYFYMEHEQGHGAGTRLRDLVTQYSRYYAFIEQELRVKN